MPSMQKANLLALLAPTQADRARNAALTVPRTGGLVSQLFDQSVVDAMRGKILQDLDLDGEAMARWIKPFLQAEIMPEVQTWVERNGPRYGIAGESKVDPNWEGVRGLQPIFLGYATIVAGVATWTLASLAGASTLYDSRLYFDDPDAELSYISQITLAGSNVWTRQGQIGSPAVTTQWVCAAARYRLQHQNYKIGEGMHLGQLPVSNSSTLTISGVCYTGVPAGTQIGAWLACIPRRGDFNLSADECACVS